MGVDKASVIAQQGLTVHDKNKVKTSREVEVDLTERKISWRSGWRCCSPIERVYSAGWTRWEAETGQLTAHESTPPSPLEPSHESTTPSSSEPELFAKPSHESTTPSSSEPELFAKLKQEHDLAKAVKLDDAEVPVDLWDLAVCRGPPSEVEKKALTVLRDFMLLRYRQQLWLDARKYLQVTHGNDWSQSRHAKVLEDVTAIHDILWRAASNNWFDYPLGSSLIFFRFPARYRTEAKRGMKVFFTSKGPSSRRRQPPLKPDEKTILRKKLLKFINKGYLDLAPHIGRLESLIKYFAIPKGVIDGVVQDWRIVFDAGANELNECVWAPSFCLPTVNLLLRITDEGTLMRDQDLGEMFLLFHLHPNTVKFTGVDLGPLEFGPEDRGQR